MVRRDNEISEFISKSVEQVKSGLPKDCVLNGNFDFDISLVTTKQKGGKIGIHLAGLSSSSVNQQVHRVRFSITDKNSRDANVHYVRKLLKDIVNEFPKEEK